MVFHFRISENEGPKLFANFIGGVGRIGDYMPKADLSVGRLRRFTLYFIFTFCLLSSVIYLLASVIRFLTSDLCYLSFVF